MVMTLSPPTSAAGPLECFRAFYRVAGELRHRVHDGAWPPPDAGNALPEAQAPLLDLLERFAEAAPADDPAQRQTRYLMAAYADDVFTRLDWPLRDAWGASTLESQLFQTDRAADMVFNRIDTLLEIGDPGRRGLARAYLMALALGFRGRYREDPDALTDYRERLLTFAVPGAPQPGDEAMQLTPDAYRHTLGSTPGKLLPNVRRWALAVIGILTLVGVLSIPLWRVATRSIGAAIENVLNP